MSTKTNKQKMNPINRHHTHQSELGDNENQEYIEQKQTHDAINGWRSNTNRGKKVTAIP